MAGDFYGGRYFPTGYFPDGYFGTGEADPNAMSGTAAGVATVTGRLTSAAVEVIPEPRVGAGGGGYWASHSDDGLDILVAKRRYTLPLPRLSRPDVAGPVPLVAADLTVPMPRLGKPRVGRDETLEVMEILTATRIAKLLRAA